MMIYVSDAKICTEIHTCTEIYATVIRTLPDRLYVHVSPCTRPCKDDEVVCNVYIDTRVIVVL